jgi:hypothetical protein
MQVIPGPRFQAEVKRLKLFVYYILVEIFFVQEMIDDG